MLEKIFIEKGMFNKNDYYCLNNLKVIFNVGIFILLHFVHQLLASAYNQLMAVDHDCWMETVNCTGVDVLADSPFEFPLDHHLFPKNKIDMVVLLNCTNFTFLTIKKNILTIWNITAAFSLFICNLIVVVTGTNFMR